ncbi:YueH family protein [Staphylococcus sp. 17KM0847]|uniref:YueH family protein n=1 Tax=Staphylococcus sp. 17KM0847 TaxID=2583989 RepID=UPI0015DC92D2|nr:YueH family protein [Staphylococcus sp. 17KM0847]QLK85663.1 hypothetical protein FGL66_02520 [Staphylococcus sp. 17KM0847]
MKIRESHSEQYSAKVFIYDNKKEDFFVVAVPDLYWSIQINDDLYGDALTDHLAIHLFNVLDEEEAQILALRITQWVQET